MESQSFEPRSLNEATRRNGAVGPVQAFRWVDQSTQHTHNAFVHSSWTFIIINVENFYILFSTNDMPVDAVKVKISRAEFPDFWVMWSTCKK